MSIEKHGKIKNKSEKNIFNILKFIDSHCSDFVTSMKESRHYLYRGVKSKFDIFLGSPPTERPQLGNGNNTRLDQILKSEHFTALRSNIICCQSNKTNLFLFGHTYFIFPINGFSFHWSPIISDFGTSRSLRRALDSTNTQYLRKELFDTLKITDKDMTAALNSRNEIAMHGNYVAIRYFSSIIDPGERQYKELYSNIIFDYYGFKG
jgi:hypothetical protein